MTNTMDDVSYATWEGRTLPVWRFPGYTDVENFLNLVEETWTLELLPDLPNRMWGVIYHDGPLDPERAIALVHIDDDEMPQEPEMETPDPNG